MSTEKTNDEQDDEQEQALRDMAETAEPNLWNVAF